MFKSKSGILVICFFASFFVRSQEGIKSADSFLNNLKNEEVKKAYAQLEVNKDAPLSEDGFIQTWQRIISMFGNLESAHYKCSDNRDAFVTAYYDLKFSNRDVILKIPLKKGKITGFFLVQDAPCDSKYSSAEYVPENSYQEEVILLNNSKLKTTLTRPKEDVQKILCIFLSGSGPQDQDGSIGPNKPLKDLALGLASKGVSTIRFGKRSLKANGKNYTINDEYTEDVLKIIDYITKDEQFLDYKIIVLGHSLGGMISPVIANNNAHVSGAILMGANFRPLEDLLIEQTKYLLSKDRRTSDIKKALYLYGLEVQVMYLKDSLSLHSELKKLPLNIPPNYWMSLKDYRLSDKKIRKKINKPMLVLWGEKDYQVKEVDFNLYKKHFQRKKNEFISYPDLNHIFMMSNDSRTPGEYKIFNNIPEYVIEDIINWLKNTYK